MAVPMPVTEDETEASSAGCVGTLKSKTESPCEATAYAKDSVARTSLKELLTLVYPAAWKGARGLLRSNKRRTDPAATMAFCPFRVSPKPLPAHGSVAANDGAAGLFTLNTWTP